MAYKHNKPLVFNEQAAEQLKEAKLKLDAPGVFISDNPETIVEAFGRARYWDR